MKYVTTLKKKLDEEAEIKRIRLEEEIKRAEEERVRKEEEDKRKAEEEAERKRLEDEWVAGATRQAKLDEAQHIQYELEQKEFENDQLQRAMDALREDKARLMVPKITVKECASWKVEKKRKGKEMALHNTYELQLLDTDIQFFAEETGTPEVKQEVKRLVSLLKGHSQ